MTIQAQRHLTKGKQQQPHHRARAAKALADGERQLTLKGLEKNKLNDLAISFRALFIIIFLPTHMSITKKMMIKISRKSKAQIV